MQFPTLISNLSPTEHYTQLYIKYLFPGSFIVTQCYGSVLHLSCNPGHRIKVLDDFFGLRTARIGEERDECRYEPGNTFFILKLHRDATKIFNAHPLNPKSVSTCNTQISFLSDI